MAQAQGVKLAIVLSCSETKSRRGDALLPVIDLYDGPRWRTLRAALRHVKHVPPIFAFSSMYGIVPTDKVVAPYDGRFYKSKVMELDKESFAALDEFDVINLSMGKFYAGVLLERIQTFSLKCSPQWTESQDIGYQRAQIWAWLIAYDFHKGLENER